MDTVGAFWQGIRFEWKLECDIGILGAGLLQNQLYGEDPFLTICR